MILISSLGLVWVNLCVVSWIGYHLDVDGFAFCFFFEVISVSPFWNLNLFITGKGVWWELWIGCGWKLPVPDLASTKKQEMRIKK